MKFTAIILLSACLTASANGFSQQITLSGKNVPLPKAFKEIQKQSGYQFLYTQNMMKEAGTVTVELRNVSLQEAVNACLKGKGLTYEIIDRTVVIKKQPEESKKEEMPPAPIDVRGRIINEKGEPVVASVQVKGKNIGTTTNDNGEFELKGVDENATLIISGVGIETFESKLNGKTVLTLTAKIKVVAGETVFVEASTGYQKIPKERATGSFEFVNNELLNRRVSTNVLDRLEGIVPGLLVNRNTSLADSRNGIDLSIRGYSTLFANGQPLIVVDNFPYDGNIQNINPNDVESVTILKDAAAASIWGVQSGNGVIVITTKKGRLNQKMGVDFNMNFTIAEKPDIYYSPDFLTSPGFISVERNLFQQGFYDGRLIDPTRPIVSPVVQILADQRSGLITADQANSQIAALENMDMRDELSKYFYRRAFAQQYSVGLRGGGEKNDYYLSFGYDKNLDGRIGNKNDRVNINTLNHFYPIKKLMFTVGMAYTNSTVQNNSPIDNLNPGIDKSALYPYAKFADANGNALSVTRDYNYAWITDSLGSSGLLNWQFKPLDELKYADNEILNTNTKLNLGAKYEFPAGISTELNYQYNRATINVSNYFSDSTYYARNLINQFTDFSLSNPYPVPVGGILQKGDAVITAHRVRGQINYNSEWNGRHNVAAILGAEVSQQISESNNSTTYGYNKETGTSQVIDAIGFYQRYPTFNSERIPYNVTFDKSTDRYVSYFGNASYTYQNKYTISASGRIDKSNLLGVSTNQKSVPLYSTGLLWDLSRESFWKVKAIPYIKIRASFGYNGNIDKSAAAVQTISRQNNSYFFGLPYAVVSNPGNPSLRWEKIRMINFGLDFRTKNNFLDVTAEYYLKKGVDIFGYSPLPPSTGLSQFFGNTANIKGHGLDLSLRFKWFKQSRFQWETMIIFSSINDVVEKYLDESVYYTDYMQINPANGSSIRPVEGRPIFAMYSYKWAGLNSTNGDPQGIVDGKASTDYATIIGTSTIDSLYYSGSARPTKFGSFRNTFSYGNLSLSFNIIYKLDYYFRRSSISYSGLFYGWSGHKDFYNRWQTPGDELKTDVPALPAAPTPDESLKSQFYRNSQALVEKGDHIRLQDISLSYNLSLKKLLGDRFNNSVTFYFYVNNVGILWRANKNGLDPDIPPSPTGALPIPRSYAFGLKTNF